MNALNYLEAKVSVSQDTTAGSLPKFLIKANAGSRMSFADEDVIVDLDGKIELKDARGLPILYGHQWDNQLGHASAVNVNRDGIWLEGVVSVPSYRSREWVASARAGFPWNASIGFVVEDSLELRDGESIEVNGREEFGPVRIATAVKIWECSVVTFGADPNTEAQIKAALDVTPSSYNNEDLEMNDENKILSVTHEQETVTAGADIAHDVEELRRKRVEENERIDAIEALAKQYNDREYLNAAISEGWSPEKFELNTLRHARSSVPTGNPVGADSINAASIALLRACGVNPKSDSYSAADFEAADAMKSTDLRGIFEAATGFTPTTSQKSDPREWVQAAVSTFHLTKVLSTTANGILLNALGNYERRWAPLFKISSVQDYRKAERWRLDANFEFDETLEGQEFTSGTQTEDGWEIQAKMYGKQYVLPYQSLINGEALGVFSDVMQQIAFGAESKLNRVCWDLIMNPPQARDGVAYYHANHGSLLTSKPFNLENLSTAITSFISRKKANDVPIGIDPRYLLVPPTLIASARNVINSTWLSSTAGKEGADYNPMNGIVEILSAPQLEFSSFTNASPTTWYLFSDPNALAPFEIAFLRGVQSPTIRSSELEIGRIGIGIDGHISFGVVAEDYRGAMKITA